MGRPAQDPIKKLKKELEKQYEAALNEMAEELTFKIEVAYSKVISKFYSDYTPRYYDRTFMTYEASDHSDDPFKVTPIAGGYEAGINVGPEFIPGNPYRADKSWVFERTFERGIHVAYDNKARLEDFILDLTTQFAIGGGVFYKGKKVKHFKDVMALVNNYELRPKGRYGVKRTSPVPKSQMDRAFYIIKGKKNLDTMATEILGKHFSKVVK